MFLFLTGVQGSVVEFVILIPIQKLILKSVSLWSNLELELESLNILKCFLCFLFSDFIQIVFLLEYFFFQVSPSISTYPKMNSLISLAFTSWVLFLDWRYHHSLSDPIQHFSHFWLFSLSHLHSVSWQVHLFILQIYLCLFILVLSNLSQSLIIPT